MHRVSIQRLVTFPRPGVCACVRVCQAARLRGLWVLRVCCVVSCCVLNGMTLFCCWQLLSDQETSSICAPNLTSPRPFGAQMEHAQFDEIHVFFVSMSWGTLSLKSRARNHVVFCTVDLVFTFPDLFVSVHARNLKTFCCGCHRNFASRVVTSRCRLGASVVSHRKLGNSVLEGMNAFFTPL